MPDQVERFNELHRNCIKGHLVRSKLTPNPEGRWVRHSDYQEMKDSRDGWERRFHAEQSERRELVGKLNLAHDLASSTKARLEEERDEARKQRDEELRQRLRNVFEKWRTRGSPTLRGSEVESRCYSIFEEADGEATS